MNNLIGPMSIFKLLEADRKISDNIMHRKVLDQNLSWFGIVATKEIKVLDENGCHRWFQEITTRMNEHVFNGQFFSERSELDKWYNKMSDLNIQLLNIKHILETLVR